MMRLLTLLLTTLWAFLSLTFTAQAQDDMASLLADQLQLTPSGQIVASGNVQITYGTAVLTASSLSYDPKTDQLTATGPIVLSQPGEKALFLADMAELDADFKNGIMRSARLVLNDNVQLAAAQLRRVDGRYTELFRTVASSCHVCAARPVPLWQIRAESIVHDMQEKRLYFRDATFEVAGLPIVYLPRMSLPEPGTTRATGFLAPRLSNSLLLGARLSLPYFITLGDHADLTITPTISNNSGLLDLRFRKAFADARIETRLGFGQDQIRPNAWRAYAFFDGQFDLGHGFDLSINLDHASDLDILAEYGLFGGTRLPSTVTLSRIRADQLIQADLTYLKTLRGAELAYASTLPDIVSSFDARFLSEATPLGGTFSWGIDGDAHRRASSADVAGRDMLRLGAGADWHRQQLLPAGLILDLHGQLRADLYGIANDSVSGTTAGGTSQAMSATLAWPLVASARNGSFHMTPRLAAGWRGFQGKRPPNEDAALQELDFGSLLSATPLTGKDLFATGPFAAASLTFGQTTNSTNWEVAIGRRWDQTALVASPSSGFAQSASDWIVSGSLDVAPFSFMTLAQFDASSFETTKLAARAGISGDRLNLGLNYAWSEADLTENRTDDLSHLRLSAGYKFDNNWQAALTAGYDFAADKPDTAEIKISYENECVLFDLSVSRRLSSSGSVRSDTNFGFDVELLGFGSGAGRRTSRACYGT